QVAEFAGRDRAEAGVAERRHPGHVAHREVQGFERRDISDAAAELSVPGQRYERSALPLQRLQAARGTLVSFALADPGLHRVASDLEESLFLLTHEGKR